MKDMLKASAQQENTKLDHTKLVREEFKKVRK